MDNTKTISFIKASELLEGFEILYYILKVSTVVTIVNRNFIEGHMVIDSKSFYDFMAQGVREANTELINSTSGLSYAEYQAYSTQSYGELDILLSRITERHIQNNNDLFFVDIKN